uniref:Uncharacterized protein n=1 Tax=Anguilla anguilla TaxID=7936 RepID=A0A0E9PXI2_ANGAN
MYCDIRCPDKSIIHQRQCLIMLYAFFPLYACLFLLHCQ